MGHVPDQSRTGQNYRHPPLARQSTKLSAPVTSPALEDVCKADRIEHFLTDVAFEQAPSEEPCTATQQATLATASPALQSES